MKDDMESASKIVEKVFKRKEREAEALRRQRLLFQAGVPGIPDPDEPSGLRSAWDAFVPPWMRSPGGRHLSMTELDDVLARALGIETPKRKGTLVDDQDPRRPGMDALEASLLAFRGPEDPTMEICGYCGRHKKKGEWCGWARCSSNTRRKRG